MRTDPVTAAGDPASGSIGDSAAAVHVRREIRTLASFDILPIRTWSDVDRT